MQPPEMTLVEFIDYLEQTLIPDLKDSGSTATAEDFETAVYYLNQLNDLRTAITIAQRGTTSCPDQLTQAC